MKQLLKRIAAKTPIYPAYESYSAKSKLRRMSRRFQEWTSDDQKRLEFYGTFVSAGDLVYDVGANLGNRSKIFLRLGASVIAVEPQSYCAGFLESMLGENPNFRLVRTALGSQVGQAEMMISDAHTLSTLSNVWVDTVQRSGRFATQQWNQRETVQINTLDNLILQFGVPRFVKIDVEGFEEEVLRGLTQPVEALSMEFAPEFIDGTFRCIDRLSQLGEYRYQFSLEESMEFDLENWVTTAEIRSVLANVPSEQFGDLYAKCFSLAEKK